MQLVQRHGPSDAGTVPVHVQVIDLEPFALDLVVPTYLPAADLTQRVARDAGLGAFWEDGSRRLFYLRARGRLLRDHEKLEDLGVVPYELLHLLPQPPEGSGLAERAPEYPQTRGYAAAGNLAAAAGVVTVLGWTAAWSVAITADRSPVVGLLPGVGLALLATSLSRHLWGGQGSEIRVPVTALAITLPLVVLAAIPSALVGHPLASVLLVVGPALVGGVFGVLLGWLAWFGAVEPLPAVSAREVKEGEALVTWPCAICGAPVTADVKADCRHRCGRVFHAGCYRAKEALSASGACAVCGFHPG